MAEFVHLHLHTEYSLLDGATKISEIADRAIKYGQRAVAITDHGVMYGAVEFYNTLKERGIKPIIGCEVYVAQRSRLHKEGKTDISGNHLVLLCKDAVGYKNLCYMVSKSFIDGFYSKPRIDMDLLRNNSEGLIALSGCVGGKIPRAILAGDMEEAEKTALDMKQLFGDDFYLEIQNHGIDDERRVAYGLKRIGEKLSIPLVATNDVHYLDREDADTQAVLMCIQTNNVITDGRPIGFERDEFYFKSTSEMEALFSAYPGAIENTVRIAEKCNFDFEFDKLHLPDFTPENGASHREQLKNDALSGFERKIAEERITFVHAPRNVYEARIEYELSVIDKMGFNAYFLIVSDFVSYAKKASIPVGPGRGSGAGSLVAFCVGITDVDPIEFNLLFERFLNPERVSMPDFDIDFCYNRREEVIDYVKSKYGEDKVAQIVTFGTLAARAAVRDVGRALGMPYGRVDTVAKLIPRDLGITIEAAIRSKELKELYYNDSEVRKLLDISMKLEGMPRHASTHAAGVVITKDPTYTYVPLSYSGTGVVTQFDMNTDAMLGLVKFDFLGLRYLTVINDAEKEIRKRITDFDITRIPLDDKKTFKLLCDARTDGVFQLESGGMKQVLSKLSPSSLEDIIACIALFRPGPMDSIDTFIARRHGREKTVYKIPELAEILDVTYGCIVYQEQVMQICRRLAGYSYARADIVRRAMAKKKTEAMQSEREAFLDGCTANGIDRELANGIFDEMVGFAKYAFNKSHATAYGLVSYRTAYLKAHYPAEYYSALLTSVLDNSQKVREYIQDAHKYGVKVLPPDVNLSYPDFSVVDGNVRFGLLAIRNVGRQFADAVVRNRKNTRYRSFDEFVSRLSDADLNKRTLESMIKCGVFDSLGVTRSSLLASYENILDSVHDKVRNNVAGQMDLFAAAIGGGKPIYADYEYPAIEEYPLKELLLLEKESSGLYFSGHMIDNYSKALSGLKLDKISDILEDTNEDNTSTDVKYKDKSQVSIAGIIIAKKTKVTKNGDTMAFITVEDSVSEIEVIVFARQYASCSSELAVENAVHITGTVSVEEGEAARILMSSLTSLRSNYEAAEHAEEIPEAKPSAEEAPKEIKEKRLYIRVPNLDDGRIQNVYRIAALNRGKVSIVLYDESTKKYSALRNVTVSASDTVILRLGKIFSPENVKFT